MSATLYTPKAQAIEFKMETKFNANDKIKIKTIKDLENEAQQIKLKRDEQKRIELENLKRQQEEIKHKEQEERMRLGRRIKFHITYYCDEDSSLEGGKHDKKGKDLNNHEYPVLALPKDVSYGAKVVFDESINGSNEYINVDTGGAITWLGSDECKADVFIGGVSPSWIERNMQNKVVYGWLKE
jgi:3D (Asp-Asp-Asp) domain-containing protein